MTSSEIRKQFLDFFHSKGHQVVPSAPIVVKNDPTLMFTNAGMNQFKDYFLGNKKSSYARVADTQKCLRVSGKHNDLEEVGVDTYHHTMFEMLGNWSFGNPDKPGSGYFKKEAIAWSWELLTGMYKLDKEKLYVTIFEGDKKEGLPKDDEAYSEWKKYIAEDRILMGNKKDNFWEMGETGPCGPCTEIHVDCRTEEERKQVDGKTLVNNDHPQVIEIWNNVFIQFNRKKDGSLEQLPAKHVDTGMGFERLVRVLQGKQSNYDTDIFTGIINEVENITGKKYEADVVDSPSSGGNQTEQRLGTKFGKEAVAFRVIADHIRAISFTIADGQLPSNTGAGYVIRRILRRAVRYYYSYLNYKQPLLYQLAPVLAKQFENVFPELQKQVDFVSKVVKEEEDAFLRTLDKGLKKIDTLPSSLLMTEADRIFGDQYDLELEPLQANAIHTRKWQYVEKKLKEIKKFNISGEIAFELYDTFGFPFDLTHLIANEKGWTIDEKGFEAEMKKQKDRSRAATAIDAEDWIILKDGSNKFVGYDSFTAQSDVLKYRKVKAKGREAFQIVLDTTPFYAESGGQIGDTGVLIFDREEIEIYDTKKDNDLIIHFANRLPKKISDTVTARINIAKRAFTKYNHTATHLLHAALRKVLGIHVTQKGSLVSDEHLRFDFSHFAKVSNDELKRIEALVNEKIRENIPIIIEEMSKEEAVKLGAMALFGEKYGDQVRVVTIDPEYSVELCGGTHANATGQLGLFKIISESAVASGVRRIEAVTGYASEEHVNRKFGLIDTISENLKYPQDIAKAVEDLAAENAKLKKKLERAEAKELVGIRNQLLKKDEIINGITFVGDIIEVDNPDALKKICFDLKNNLNDYVVVLCANIGGKPFVAIGISDTVAVSKNLDAGKIIKEHVAPLIRGGGGGQKTLATAGGQEAGNLKQVIEVVKKLLYYQ